jgi:genome maintenance exonuclease 1
MIVIGNFHHLSLNIKPVNLERKEIAGQRFYQTPDGLFPSVTTVTGHEKKKFFAEWRNNNKIESARVCSRGNTLHSVIEKYLLNEKIDLSQYDDNIRDLFHTLKPEVDKINNIRCLEFPLYSNILQMAGRVDCIAEHNKELAVIDFKGSTKTKYKKDIENYFNQATAYALMWQNMTGEKIKKIKILIATEDGTCQIFEEETIKHVSSLKQIRDTYISETLL